MTYEDLQFWLGLAGVIVATIAACIALRMECRNQKRWQADMDRNDQIATANVKPLLTFTGLEYENKRGLRLTNNGLGPALITSVAIECNGRQANTIPDVLEIEHQVVWDTFRRFVEPYEPVAVNEELMLVKLTVDQLRNEEIQNRKIDEAEIVEMMESLKCGLTDVQVRISYTDIFGNAQPDSVRNC